MLAILPTDTCYGLAGDFTEQDYHEIYRLKGRDFGNRLALLVRDFAMLREYAEVTDEQIEFLQNYKNPWSVILPRKSVKKFPKPLREKEYEYISFRVAEVCLKSPPDKGGRGVSYIPYRVDLTKKAQENRKNMNAPERKMWYDILRMEELRKYKFLRQKPLGDYIVDFYCQELGIVIEIDGDSHIEQGEYDKTRSEFLGGYGLDVVRFTNQEVLKNTEGVYEYIVQYIQKPKNQPPNPPTPLIRGANQKPIPQPPLSGGQIQFPMFLTSANRSGHAESTTLDHAKSIFLGIEGIDGGVCDRPPSDIFRFLQNGEIEYMRRNYLS